VVEGARLENESADAHRSTPKNLLSQPLQQLPVDKMFVGVPPSVPTFPALF
jgi:hypothetical protein